MCSARSHWFAALCLAALGLALGTDARAQTPEPRWTNPVVGRGSARPTATFGARWRVDRVRWTAWGAETATGAGQAILFGSSASDRISAAFDVTVTLSAVVDCLGTPIYTRMAIAPAEGVQAPDGFSLTPLTRPCSVQPQLCGEKSACQPPSRPRLPPRGSAQDPSLGDLDELFHTTLSPVGVRWRRLGSRVATGVGYVNTRIKLGTSNQILQRTGEEPRVYPIRFTLSQPRWCGGAMRYTTLRAAVYGAGIARRKYADPHAIPAGATRRALDRDAKRRASHRATARRGAAVRWTIKPAAIKKTLASCEP